MAVGPDRAHPSSESRSRNGDSRPRKALTIGAVCKILEQEFDDISISKIRYLEDQKLLAPRRTRGGYRLYSQADVEQLRAILRMQRDEFLPLKVIRQELAAGKIGGGRDASGASARRAIALDEPGGWIDGEELIEQTGVSAELLRELEDFGIVQPAAPCRAALLRRDRRRDRSRRHRARPVRRPGPEPARLPDVRRARGVSARADHGPVASVPQPGAPQGGAREPRGPGGDLHTAEAPAARARSAPAPRLALRRRVRADRRRSRSIPVGPDEVWRLVSRSPQPAALVARHDPGRVGRR